jgi:hypothetical protein
MPLAGSLAALAQRRTRLFALEIDVTYEFLKLVIDTITEHIVVIDSDGYIWFTNKTRNSFWANNSGLIDGRWDGVNDLEECDKAADMDDDFGAKVASSIRSDQ